VWRASAAYTGSPPRAGKRCDVDEYSPREVTLPAFDLAGFTKLVTSGGEQFEEVWGDGRWEQLRRLGGADPTIWGVASHDREAPEGHYRYTVAVKATEDRVKEAGLEGRLFPMHVAASEWLVFTLSFSGSFGKLWQDDPYKIISQLGWDFNRALGIHIDVFPPSYVEHDDDFEFWMPVKRPDQTEGR